MFKMIKAIFALFTGATTLLSDNGLKILDNSLQIGVKASWGANQILAIEIDSAVAEAMEDATPIPTPAPTKRKSK